MQSVQLIQNGLEDDGSIKYEPKFLTNGQSAALSEIVDRSGNLVQNAVGDVNDVSTGLQTAIDTITYLRKQIVKQIFYEVNLTDYGIIEQGDGAWNQNILVTREYDASEDFEAGNVNQAGNNDRLSSSETAIDGVNVPIRNWAKSIKYNLFEVQQALQRNNWDVVEGRMRSRVKNWQLGIQATFFLGSKTDTAFPGLLNNSAYTTNTTFITALINSLSAANFQAFVQGIVQLYQANCAYTRYPDYFIMPSNDYNGLGTATASGFPIGTMLEYLEKTFKGLCGQHFKILPSAYGVPANNSAWGINKTLYLLGRMDADSGHMNIPVDMIVSAPGSADNFNYQSVGYAQYTGYNIFRNAEFLGFSF
jgi:hypothetical protein